MIYIIVIAIIIFAVLVSAAQLYSKRHRQNLLSKYGDSGLVERLLSQEVWIGQTAEMLRDSRGHPAKTDQRVLKTKIKETWKYHRVGANRYALRIYLEDGIVVGWDDKR